MKQISLNEAMNEHSIDDLKEVLKAVNYEIIAAKKELPKNLQEKIGKLEELVFMAGWIFLALRIKESKDIKQEDIRSENKEPK